VAFAADVEPDAADEAGELPGEMTLMVIVGDVTGLVEDEAAYPPDDVPDEARWLTYHPTSSVDEEALHDPIGVVLAVLGGTPLRDAGEQVFDDDA